MKFKIKIQFILLAAILVLFLLTRLYGLKLMPIFTDEAIYLFWAKIALHDPANRFISLEDGKQPLFIWLSAIFQIFIKDPLIAARLVSVFAGFGSVIGIFLLSKELFSSLKEDIKTRIALISSFLYVVLPFTLLYDKLSLFDSLLTMLGIYSVFLTIKMVKKPALDIALINGFTLGFAFLTKSSALFFIGLLPFSLILFERGKNNLKRKFFKWLVLSSISVVLAQAMYNGLRLSPLFYIIARKNLEFIRPLSDVINDPFVFFFSNARGLTEWLVAYLSLPLFVVFILGLIYGILTKNKNIHYLAVLIALPFFAEALFNKILYARFILFYFPFVIIISAYFINIALTKFQKREKLIWLVFGLILVLPIYSSFKLLSNPPTAPIPRGDSNQFFNDWPAGYGVEELREILEKESQDKQVYIGTQGTFGLFPHSLNAYFFENKNLHVLPYWPVNPDKLPEEVLNIAKNHKTFFVFNEYQKDINNPNLRLIAKYKKGISTNYMRLYEVSP